MSLFAEIWSNRPDAGGHVIMSTHKNNGIPIGWSEIDFNFGGQSLSAGSYWLTTYMQAPTYSFAWGGKNQIVGVPGIEISSSGAVRNLNDDLQFRISTSTTPIPAAAWLCISALLGLGVIVRNRRNVKCNAVAVPP